MLLRDYLYLKYPHPDSLINSPSNLALVGFTSCVFGSWIPIPSVMNSVTGIFRILATPQNPVTSLYGSFRAEKLPYKAVTELCCLMQCCKDSAKPCIRLCASKGCGRRVHMDKDVPEGVHSTHMVKPWYNQQGVSSNGNGTSRSRSHGSTWWSRAMLTALKTFHTFKTDSG